MSVDVLMAIMDERLFSALTEPERDAATQALVAEIKSDAELEARLRTRVESRLAQLSAARAETTA